MLDDTDHIQEKKYGLPSTWFHKLIEIITLEKAYANQKRQ